jgi:hypothetical protein
MMAKLQSQTYRSRIDACNECLEGCELCAIRCLHDENVKSLANGVEIYVTCSPCLSCCITCNVLVMSGESAYSKKVCGLCAEICERV